MGQFHDIFKILIKIIPLISSDACSLQVSVIELDTLYKHIIFSLLCGIAALWVNVTNAVMSIEL
jgi:hypothetical protein